MSRLLLALALAVLAPFSPAQKIEVLVTDARRAPIAGASVTCFEGAQPESVATGSDGRCALALAPAPRPIHLRVQAPGFFHADAQWLAKERIEVVLRESVALEGRARLFGTDTPVADVRIEIAHPGCRGCASEVAVGDAEGRFSFASLPSGVELELHAGSPNVPRQSIVLGALDGTNGKGREIELDPGHSLHGRVVDFTTGAAIAGALVATLPGRLNEVRTNAEGRFEITAVAESFRQMIRFEITAEGHCKLGVVLSASEIVPGKELRCPLPGLASVRGIVYDGEDRPVPGAEVFAREDSNWVTKRRARGATTPPIPLDDLPSTWSVSSGDANARAVCDERGVFVLDRVCPWTPELLLHSQHPVAGGAQQQVGPIGAPGSTLEVAIRPAPPQPGGRIEGTLTFNGQPVQAVLGWRGPTRNGRIFVDPRGRFAGPGIEPGEVNLWVELIQPRTGGLGKLFQRESVTLQVALDQVAQHSFELAHPMATITGRVVDGRGAPKPQVAVGAHEPTLGMQCNGTTDVDGRFELSVPQLDLAWRVQVTFGVQPIERAGVRAGGEELTFVVPDMGRLRARFLDEKTGASLAPAMLMWRRAGATGFETRSLALEPDRDELGWMRAAIPAGDWEIAAWVARASYPPSALRPVKVGADELVTLEFALREGRPVVFRLADASAKPPRDESAAAWLVESSWWAPREGSAPDDMSRRAIVLPPLAERFRILAWDGLWKAQVPGLKPGRYRFVTAMPGDSIEPAEIEIRGDESEPVEIHWKRSP